MEENNFIDSSQVFIAPDHNAQSAGSKSSKISSKNSSKKRSTLIRGVLIGLSYGFVFLLGFSLCFFVPFNQRDNKDTPSSDAEKAVLENVLMLRQLMDARLETMNQSINKVLENIQRFNNSMTKQSEAKKNNTPTTATTTTTTTTTRAANTTSSTTTPASSSTRMLFKTASNVGDQNIRLSCEGSVSNGDAILISLIKYTNIKADDSTLQKSQQFCKENLRQEGDSVVCMYSLKRLFGGSYTEQLYVEYKCYL